jgi:hypothetical protein
MCNMRTGGSCGGNRFQLRDPGECLSKPFNSALNNVTPRNCPRVMREILDWSISSSAAAPCCVSGENWDKAH